MVQVRHCAAKGNACVGQSVIRPERTFMLCMITSQVWAEPLCKRHYAGLLSFAFFLRVAVHLGIIALSLVIAFATGGFWVKVKPSLDQPHVHYTNDALIVFEVGWAALPAQMLHAS
jgi:hypothetical protein